MSPRTCGELRLKLPPLSCEIVELALRLRETAQQADEFYVCPIEHRSSCFFLLGEFLSIPIQAHALSADRDTI
eukprot:1637441-Amphidinium_carterae.1